MKILVVILGVLNAFVAALIAQGATDRVAGSGHGLPAPELTPERIRLVTPDAATTPAPPRPVPEAAPRSEAPVRPELATPVLVREEAARPVTRQCIEWANLRANDSARALRVLDEMKLAGATVETPRVEGGATWMVYIPPAASRRAADQRVADLKRLRVDEFYVLGDNGFANAISLGVFSSEAGAISRRDALQKQGVRDAAIVPRPTGDQRVTLRIVGLTEADANRTREFARDFTGTDIRGCTLEQAKGG